LAATPKCSALPTQDDIQELRELLHQVYRRKYNTWEHDITVMLPRYDAKHNMWRAAVRIIALTSDLDKLYDVQSKLGPVCASQWKDAGPADGYTLAQTIGRELSYQAPMLYRNRPALDIEKIQSVFANTRKIRRHGIQVYKQYETLNIIKESKALGILPNEKYQELFNDGGHAPASADVAESS